MQKVELIQKIKCCDIMNDPNNPRKDISNVEDLELQRSIKEFGIIQPIMVRPVDHQEFKYMIVYGHRRFEAYCSLNAITISCIVKNLNDEAALEYQIIENLQRKGINPMEESNAFQRLIKFRLSTAEVIADKLGVSTKYVYDRLTLQKVLPEVQAAVMNGKISITHGLQFARLQTADQVKLLKNVNLSNDKLQVADIRSVITSMFKLNLNATIFDIDNAKLVEKAGSCIKCKKRSGCNVLLFEDVQLEDVCFDSVCYESKVQAHIDEQIKSLQEKGKIVKLISGKFGGAKDGLLDQNNWMIETEETNTVGIFLEVSPYYYKVGEVINLEDDVEENDDDSNGDGYGVKDSVPSQRIDYKTLFAEKSMDAIIEAYHDISVTFPYSNKEDIITESLISLFAEARNIVYRKIAASLEIPLTIRSEILAEFKKHAESLLLQGQLELIFLIKQLGRIDDFDSMPDQSDIESEEVILQEYRIDFFKIAADLNAPYPLFTPTKVAETTEA